MARFNDDELLERFDKFKEYPKIHDDIFTMIEAVKPKRVIDLGCCYGLLAYRIAVNADAVIGIDPNANYLKKAVQKDNIKYYKLQVNKDTCEVLQELIAKFKIDTIVCRRVIPELYETGGFELVNAFTDAVATGGAKYIILEGRKSNRNAVNPLFCADKEAQAISKRFKCIAEYKNCRVMEKRT